MREPLEEVGGFAREEAREIDGVDLWDNELEAAQEGGVVVEAHTLVVFVPYCEFVHKKSE